MGCKRIRRGQASKRLCKGDIREGSSNRLIIFFLHAERAQFTFCRQEDELGPVTRGEEEDYLRRWSRAVELAMTVAVLGGAAVAMTVRPSDSSGASSPLCRDTSQRFLPCRFFLFILFLPSPRLSLSVSLSISPVFSCFSVSVVSLSTQSVSLSQFPPLFYRFLPLFFFLSGHYL